MLFCTESEQWHYSLLSLLGFLESFRKALGWTMLALQNLFSIHGEVSRRFYFSAGAALSLKFSVDNFALWLMTASHDALNYLLPFVEAKELLFKNTSVPFFVATFFGLCRLHLSVATSRCVVICRLSDVGVIVFRSFSQFAHNSPSIGSSVKAPA